MQIIILLSEDFYFMLSLARVSRLTKPHTSWQRYCSSVHGVHLLGSNRIESNGRQSPSIHSPGFTPIRLGQELVARNFSGVKLYSEQEVEAELLKAIDSNPWKWAFLQDASKSLGFNCRPIAKALPSLETRGAGVAAYCIRSGDSIVHQPLSCLFPAAVDFMAVLDRDYGTIEHYPKTFIALKAFIDSLRQGTDASSDLQDWFRFHEKSDLSTMERDIRRQLQVLGFCKPKDNKIIWMEPDLHKITLVDSQSMLRSLELFGAIRRLVTDASRYAPAEGKMRPVIAIDCEGVPENLYLLQLATNDDTFVFDCVQLSPVEVCHELREVFQSPNIIKMFHDLHKDAAALRDIGKVTELRGCFDSQLAMELLTGNHAVGFNSTLEHFGHAKSLQKILLREEVDTGNGAIFAKRPLGENALKYAADDVRLLHGLHEPLFCAVEKEATVSLLVEASDQRARRASVSGGTRSIAFDADDAYRMSSQELLRLHRPHTMMKPAPVIVSNESSSLLDLLPDDLSDAFPTEDMADLLEIVLDKGRSPMYWAGETRKVLGDENRLVTEADLTIITEKIGKFGRDNRACLD